jgi:hypothetical protein
MSRVTTPARITVRPQPNIYTSLAIIGFLATLASLIYIAVEYKAMIGF